MIFHDELMFTDLAVTDRDEVLSTLGSAVIAQGYANSNYVSALREREAEYPTGLAISGGVAIPHTAADFVTGNTIAVASLKNPVKFGAMGEGPDSLVDVSAVFMLVIADSTQHVPFLSKLIRRLQKQDFVDAVRTADDKSAVSALLRETFS